VNTWTVLPHHDRAVDPAQLLGLLTGQGWWPDRTVEGLRDVLGRGPAVGAWSGEHLIGFARAVTDGDYRAYVEDVVVDERFRHQGLGTVLLEVLLDLVPATAVTSLFCNKDLAPFYVDLGFRATSQRVLHRGPRREVLQVAPSQAHDVLDAYLHDVISRFHGRPARPEEVEQTRRDEPVDDVAALFVVREGGVDIACGGVRLADEEIAELTKVFVRPQHQGQGVGALVVRRLETFARQQGRRSVRLDTRTDLVEARRLYARLGYREVAPFNADPFAQHWFEKTI